MPSRDIQPGCSKDVTEKTTVCKKANKRKLVVFKDNAVISTSNAYVDKINKQIARYFFATNTPFLHVKHPEFIKLCQLLWPGYKPPTRKQLGGNILDQVHNTVLGDSKEQLEGQTAAMCLDGWSNVCNEPIVCASAALPTGATYLIDSVDTSGSPHTADNL